jgi:hypothetical protein
MLCMSMISRWTAAGLPTLWADPHQLQQVVVDDESGLTSALEYLLHYPQRLLEQIGAPRLSKPFTATEVRRVVQQALQAL